MRVVIRGAKEDREAIFKVHALLVEEGHQPVLPPEWRGEVLDPTVVAVMLGVELMEAHAVVVVTGHAGSRSAWVGGEIKTAENLNRQVVKIEASKIPDVYSTKLQLRAGLQGAHTKELPEEALAYRIAKDPARLERLRAVTKDIKPFDGSSTKAMELLKQSATPEERRVLQEIWDRAEAQCRARAEDQGWLGNPYAAGDAALEALEEVEARIERAKPPTVRPDDSYADKQLAAVLVDHFWRS
ncbi:MAG TPA: hypothetical protein PKY30_09335, partial [Myxococcota bacterium]|nr:hypothetical protein [Myxococcota bacterium]